MKSLDDKETQLRISFLIMTLGHMVLVAARTDHSKLSEDDMEKVIGNLSDIQSEIVARLRIPKDIVIESMSMLNDVMGMDEQKIEEMKDALHSLADSKAGMA